VGEGEAAGELAGTAEDAQDLAIEADTGMRS